MSAVVSFMVYCILGSCREMISCASVIVQDFYRVDSRR